MGEIKKVLIAVGAYAPVNQNVYRNHIDLLLNEACHKPADVHFAVKVWARTPLTTFRSQAAKDVIENDFTHLMFLDDDLMIAWEDGTSFLHWFLRHDAPVVSAIVHGRMFPFLPLVFIRETKEREPGQPLQISHRPLGMWKEDEGNTIMADATHLACTMITSDLLKTMFEKDEDLFISDAQCSDDFHFFLKALHYAKVRPIVDTSIKTGHIGPEQILTKELFDESMEKIEKEPGTLCEKLSKYGWHMAPEDLEEKDDS